jgi:hypothetical protein
MTRICAWCQADLGERCPKCHSLKVVTGPSLIEGEPARAECRACGHNFRRGEGGETHSVCEGCRAKANGHQPPPQRTELEYEWQQELAASIRSLMMRKRATRAQAWAALVAVVNHPDTEERLGKNAI